LKQYEPIKVNPSKPPPVRSKTLRPSGIRAYWLAGSQGIILEAALADLVHHDGGARLVISKRRVGQHYQYAFEISKDK